MSRLLSSVAVLFALSSTASLHAALLFDGAGDYVEVPNFQNLGITSEVTVEFWAVTTVTAQQSAFMLDPDNGNNRFQAHISYFNGNTYWDFGDIATTGRLFTPNPPGTVGNWTHYAFVASQSAATGKMRIYVNGAQVASKDTMDPWDAASSVLRIGGSTGNFFQGALDDFRVWNVVRSQDDIRRTMIGPLTGGEAGLRLYFKFDDATGTTAVNSATATGAAFNGTLNGDSLWSILALRTYTVANANDSGDGSLRQAFADAAASSGPALITFAPALSGQTITLSSEIAVGDTAGVAVDASSLPGGVTVSGGGAKRLFYLDSGTLATFRAATFTGGNGVGAFDSGRGGAIYSNNATLTLDRCTLHGNTAASASGDGGAVFVNFGTVALTNCTLTAHSAGWRGGAIFNKGTLTLTHCTVAGNSATGPGFGEGGGIYNEFVACTLDNSIVATNTAASGFGTQILQDGGTLTRLGANLVSSLAAGTDLFNGAVLAGGGTVSNAAPNLAALASNGGPTQTMLPNAGSPAIDSGVGSTAATDQRGITRPLDGDGDGNAVADMGAVEAPTFVPPSLVVHNAADSGAGSLRQVIADAASVPGTAATRVVSFVPALSGQTITLTTGQLSPGVGLTIDASSLSAGITISGNGASRIFEVAMGTTVVLKQLTLTGGNGVGSTASEQGGAIYSMGDLTLDRCTLTGNTADDEGGAVRSVASGFHASHCTFSGNTAIVGGACSIANSGEAAMLTHCTIAGNTATGVSLVPLGDIGGGGLFLYEKNITITNTIIAGNSSPHSPDVQNFAIAPTSGGGNLIGDATGLILSPLPTDVVGSGASPIHPRLASLGNYGGPTQTMPPLPGSPAIDGGVSTTDSTDQRGATRVADGDGNGSAIADIGAVEFTPATVTSTADSGPGSLCEALPLPFITAITFDALLNGSTLTLTSGQITINRSVVIDASTLPNGLTISGNSDGDHVLEPGESRIFDIPAGVTVMLRGLNFINGIADPTDITLDGDGGAIRSSGQLTVDRCTVSGCRALLGAGIYNHSGGTLTVIQSTLSGNSASSSGAGICNYIDGTATLIQSTVSGNAASSNAGGIYNFGNLTLQNSIVAGNSAATGADIRNFDLGADPAYTCVGANLVQSVNNTGTVIESGPAAITGDPLLVPLGNYGGPTPTRPPLPGSPAIDAGGSTTDTTDQRGAPRVADGDGNGSAIVDIGAVEVIPAIVTSTADSGAGSLRAALMAPTTDVVLFDSSLGGQTITLTSGPITPSRSLGIDATSLTGGITISGNSDGDDTPEAGESRIFEIPAGVAVTLRGLHLTHGIADPASDSATGEGGAIRNSGQLTLDLCAISNSRSKRGGAINSTGVLTVGRSTFQQNTATFGGAIHSTGSGLLTVADSTFLMNNAGGRGGAVLENDVDSPPGHPTLTRCTFHGNAASLGGAVDSFSLTNLIHCTLSDNSAGNIGGGVLASSTSVVTLTNCVVAGNANTSGSSPNLGTEGSGFYMTDGVNLTSDLTGSGLSAGSTLLTGDPQLAPIADYGGPTQTRALLPGSPARDASSGSTITSDQRGFPIVGTADIGAYETGTFTHFNAWIYETLPASATAPQHATTYDFDGDGVSNQNEWFARTDPTSNASYFRVTQSAISGNIFNVTFPTVSGRTYQLQSSPDLANPWTNIGTTTAGTGGNVTLPVNTGTETRYFFRVSVGGP